MKTIVKILLLLGVAAYLGFAIIKFAHPTEEVTCEAVEILINDSLHENFVTTDDIHQILTEKKVYVEGKKLSDIDLPQIEAYLQESPYIGKVLCYYTGSGTLLIQVTPRHPILHIISQNGEDYYLDQTGEAMPTADFNLNLCVATGNISKPFARKELVSLAKFINEDPFWNQQAEQIHVVSEKNIEICPRTGSHLIVLGPANGFQDKLQRMKLFYEKGLPRIGWNKYKTINLTFDNQVVCTKR